MTFLDLHSHVLPGLDDGSPDAPTSMSMIRGLAAIGFKEICATPHQKAGQFLPTADAIRAAHSSTATAIAADGIGTTLHLAAENMWDGTFYARCQSADIPSYNGGSAFLVEFPLGPSLPIGLFERLFELTMAGKLPVIAHPERYEPLWSSLDLVERLRDNCALVVDLGALAGYHGRKRAKSARAMVKNRLAHAAASDAHSPGDIRVAAEGIAWIRKKLGDAEVTRLLDTGPRQILAGEHPG